MITIKLLTEHAESTDAEGVERSEAPFAVQLGLLQEVKPFDGIYPYTMKTSYSSGQESTDN